MAYNNTVTQEGFRRLCLSEAIQNMESNKSKIRLILSTTAQINLIHLIRGSTSFWFLIIVIVQEQRFERREQELFKGSTLLRICTLKGSLCREFSAFVFSNYFVIKRMYMIKNQSTYFVNLIFLSDFSYLKIGNGISGVKLEDLEASFSLTQGIVR